MSSASLRDSLATGKLPYPWLLKIWLITGLVMIFFQIVIGGITRLTGSGLSITKWEIVTGTLPPLSESQWVAEFELYKQTPQYLKINEGMTLSSFKFIYFWEYIHRLWARMMGFVFAIPFLIFWRKGWIDRQLMRKLGVVILLAALVASFGWIMVASGLVDRPWVNAYKLTLHLSLAIILFSYLLNTTFGVFELKKRVFHNRVLKNWSTGLVILLAVQIMLGGLMSGMKAALSYPTWPMMHGYWIPDILLDGANWKWVHFIDYDKNPFMPALVQVLHRSVAYLLVISGLYFFYRGLSLSKSSTFSFGLYLWAGFLLLQVFLGILTLIHSIGFIPVGLGVLHQGGAIVLLSVSLFLHYQLEK